MYVIGFIKLNDLVLKLNNNLNEKSKKDRKKNLYFSSLGEKMLLQTQDVSVQ